MWPENNTCELALSFQEKSGCDEVWKTIRKVSGEVVVLKKFE